MIAQICTLLYTAKGTVAAEPYLLFNTILTIHDSIDYGNQPGLFNCNAMLQCNNQYGYQPGLFVVYYSILQYITATSRQSGYQPILSACSIILKYTTIHRGTSQQYGYQPILSAVYNRATIHQYITATSRKYGYQPILYAVYYSILQTGSADSHIAGW